MIRKPKLPKKSPAQAMVEFALVLPILLLVVYGLLEVGRLLFIYASTVTAARQAVRYGSATGVNDAGVPFYQDCAGITAAAQSVGFINRFNASDIHITYDRGVDGSGDPVAISGIDPSPNADSCPAGNGVIQSKDRIKVQVSTQWIPIVPLVPLDPFTITSESVRTIIGNVTIEVDAPPAEFTGTNNPPTTSGIPDVNVNEDSPNTNIDLFPSFEDTEDPDVVLLYSIISNTNPSLFSSVTVTGTPRQYLTLAYAPNANGSAQITIQAMDTDGNTVQTTFTVVVNPVNDPPTDLSLSNTRVDENLPPNTVVGVLTTSDVDVPYDTFTYSLCSAEGAGVFSFDGNSLVTDVILDYETTRSYNICIRSTDSGGLYVERSFTINVNNTPDPVGTWTPSATPTNTGTPTSTPTATFTSTVTNTPTLTPTAITTCSTSTVTHGSLSLSGNTMSMTITNNTGYILYPSYVSVAWNHTKGHFDTGKDADKTLYLQQVSLGSVFWTGNVYAPSYTLTPLNSIMPAIPQGTSTIVFTFDKTYDTIDKTERIILTIGTNGCNNLVLDSNN